jgi:hypothetical protein
VYLVDGLKASFLGPEMGLPSKDQVKRALADPDGILTFNQNNKITFIPSRNVTMVDLEEVT